MAQRFINPLFSKVLRTLSAETREYLEDNGLDNQGVFESFLGDVDVCVEDLASTPSDVRGLEALLKEANRAQRLSAVTILELVDSDGRRAASDTL